MDKILSIIIPTYNMEKYLRRCLESLIVSDEIMKKVEVLVINDGSKDSSSVIAHEYESRYPQTIKVIDKDNGNYGSCINCGLKEASGKYVKVLDADDYFCKEVFEKFVPFLCKTSADLILTDYNEVNEHNVVTKRHMIPYLKEQLFMIDDYCSDYYFSTQLQMHAVTYRLAYLMEHNYIQTEGVSYTDQEWVFIPITYMKTFCHFQGSLYQYLVGREGQTIDVAVTSKCVNTSFNLIRKRISIFEKEYDIKQLSLHKLEFLKGRLMNSIGTMYRKSLIKDEFSILLIEEFDNYLEKKNPYIFNEIGISKICKIRNLGYINYWRKHKKLPPIVKLMKFLYKMRMNH